MSKKKEERTCLTCRYLGIRYGKGCYHCLKYGGKTFAETTCVGFKPKGEKA